VTLVQVIFHKGTYYRLPTLKFSFLKTAV